ncbi:unnamed protein product [Withania somnifera]
MANSSDSDAHKQMSLHLLPAALLATVMRKLDIASIRSLACTCKAFRSCASHMLYFIPDFHLLDIAPSAKFLRPLLPPNPYLRCLKVDCMRLDDSSLDLSSSDDFTRALFLYLSSLAEKRGRSIDVSDLEVLFGGCTQLETLILMFDVSMFLRHNFARIWAIDPATLLSLEMGYISSVMVTELLSPPVVPYQSIEHIRPSILPGLQKLYLSVDYITDTMVSTITKNLNCLTHLDLRDLPIMEPRLAFDLSNAGIQQINLHGRLKHMSLVRSQEMFPAYFKRVNDLGILLMADRCSDMESICLGGFCQVTDTGFRTILHSCAKLYKLRIYHGPHLTDLVFHDIAETSLTLTHVSLRWCNLLTNHGVTRLVSNGNLSTISNLSELKALLIDGSDISDMGLSHLSKGTMSLLVSLSIRGCKRLTDNCISFLFEESSNCELRELDLSNIPNLSGAGILLLAKRRIPLLELRMRQCPLISDTSIMVLASTKVDEEGWCGSSLQLLDLYNCEGITQLSFQWLKKPYFPRLRWLGVSSSVSRDVLDALSRNRPFLHVAFHGEELGTTGQWDNSDDLYMHDYDEVDELEQWIERRK